MSLTGKEIAQMHKDYVMQSWSKSGVDALPVERAEGIYFYDYDGNKYADMASLLVCSNLGHELPEIVNAIKEQADKMCFMAPAYASEPKNDTPENNFTCPLVELKLLKKVEKDTYKKEKSSISNLDPYIVYWLILNQAKDRDSINIEELLNEDNSAANLLNLDKILLNEYLDILKRLNLITLNRTAGLNMVYINQRYTLRKIFEIHYGREQEN